MSFENFPSAAQVPQPAPAPGQNNWRNFLTIGLVMALLGTWGYIIWDKNKAKETILQKDNVIANTTTQKEVLQKELEDATMRYDMIKTSSANMLHSKDSVITKRDREIAGKKEKIRQILAKVNATKEELAEAGSMIASLNGDIDNFKSKIEKLEGEKLVLVQEKESISRQRDQVNNDLDSAKKMLTLKEELLNIGSTLHASNFSIIGINEKHNGNEKETNTAKRVDKFRISFDLDENRIIQSGVKDIYICITAPDGKVVSSGKINTRDGAEKIFTQKVEVNYTQGQRQPVNLEWKQNAAYQTGEYKIEIYNNGFKIGEGLRPLKKGGIFG